MKIYSIVRIGTEYVVQAGEKSILKVASRRKAARLVSDARELLDTHAAPQQSPQADVEPSIIPDAGEMPDPRDMADAGGISDPEVIPDPEIMPDPAKVP